jgi:hypothetical protein
MGRIINRIYNCLFEEYLKIVNKSFPNLLLAFVLNLVTWGVIFFIVLPKSGKFDSDLSCILFFFCLPLLQLLIISFTSNNIVRGHFTIISFLGISSYLSLWLIYINGVFSHDNLYLLPILLSFVFVLFSIHATFHILADTDIDEKIHPNIREFSQV